MPTIRQSFIQQSIDQFCSMTIIWEPSPKKNSLHKYIQKYGITHCIQSGRVRDAKEKLYDIFFLVEFCRAHSTILYPLMSWRILGSEEIEKRYLEKISDLTLHTDSPDISDIGLIFTDMGLLHVGLSYANRVAQEQERLYGKDSVQTIKALQNSVNLHIQVGKSREGLAIIKTVLQANIKRYGEKSPETIESQYLLGSLYQNIKDYTKAEEIFNMIYRYSAEIYEESNPKRLASAHNLAGIYREQGQYNKAEKLSSWVVTQNQEILGLQHPDTLISMDAFARVLIYQGKLKDAEDILRLVLEQTESLMGHVHPLTVNAMYSLARCLMSCQQYEDAKQLFSDVYDINLKKMGHLHSNTITTRGSLANIYCFLGDHKTAEKYYLESLLWGKELFGEDSSALITTLLDLHDLFLQQYRVDDSKAYLDEALRIAQKVWKQEDPLALPSMQALANWHRFKGEYGRSKEQYEKINQLEEKFFGACHPNTLSSKVQYAFLLSEIGEHEQYTQVLQYCYEQYHTLMGNHHPSTIRMEMRFAIAKHTQYEAISQILPQLLHKSDSVLGVDHPCSIEILHEIVRVFTEKKAVEACIPFNLSLIQRIQRTRGESCREFLDMTQNLAHLYALQKDFAKAEEIVADIILKKESILSPEDPSIFSSIHHLAELKSVQKKYDQAEEVYRSFIQRTARVFGNEDQDIPFTLARLAKIHRKQKNWEQEEEYLQQELSHRKRYPPKGPQVTEQSIQVQQLQVLFFIGIAKRNQQQYDDARASLQECWEGRKKWLGYDHPKTCFALVQLSNIYYLQERYADSVVYYETYIRTFTDRDFASLTEKEQDQLLRVYARLRQSLLSLERYEQMVAHLKIECSCIKDRFGLVHVRTLEVLKSLSMSLWNQHRLEEATPIFEEFLYVCTRLIFVEEYPSFLEDIHANITFFEERQEYVVLLESHKFLWNSFVEQGCTEERRWVIQNNYAWLMLEHTHQNPEELFIGLLEFWNDPSIWIYHWVQLGVSLSKAIHNQNWDNVREAYQNLAQMLEVDDPRLEKAKRRISIVQKKYATSSLR